MLILDTHAWIWYVTESENLSNNSRKAIKSADICGVSAISCWEVAMLCKKERIKLSMDLENWMNLALNFPKIKLLPITPQISIKSVQFDNLHSDPADRFIIATSFVNNSILITKDKKIIDSKIVKTIW